MSAYNNKFIKLNKMGYIKYIRNGILGNVGYDTNSYNTLPEDTITDVIKPDNLKLHYRFKLIFSMKKTSGYILNNAFQNSILGTGNGLIADVYFSNLETIGSYSLQNCFSQTKNLNSVNMDKVTTIEDYGLSGCFHDCQSLATPPTFPNLTTIGSYGLNYCFSGCTSIKNIPTFSYITNIGENGLSSCFGYCTSLTTASTLANLISVEKSGLYYCFNNCTSLTTPPTFSSLTNIGESGLCTCFYGCTSLTTAPTFDNVTSVDTRGLYLCFNGCTSLTTAPTFANLASINGNYALQRCFQNTKITSLSFPKLNSTSFGTYTNQFNNMLYGVTGCTVHFPSNLQSVIGSWSDVTDGFGGTNTTVLFDLPATT